ncbi:MAG: hypothetical protein U0Y68_25680 [Blastocatellia bacterium]
MNADDRHASNESRLLIRRFHANYQVAAEHPSPVILRQRLDDALTQELSATLAAAASALCPDGDESVWLIRRLEITLDINAAWQREAIARAVARQILREQALAMRPGQTGGNVLWFPNRAAYLAHFLVDLAEGNAWNQWYYEEFAGLRLLPASAALRTALCVDAAWGLQALLTLTPVALRRVTGSLHAGDARQVLEAVAVVTTAADEQACFLAAWDILQQEPLTETTPTAELRLFLTALRAHPQTGGAALRTTLRALLCLARHCREQTSAQLSRLLAALREKETAALFGAAGAADAELLLPLLRCDAGWIAQVAQSLRGSSARVAHTEEREPRDTAFGGTFLLLPLLAEMPLAEAAHGWPHADEAAAVTLLRWLLLSKCHGRANAVRVWADPLLLDLMLIPPALNRAALARWSTRISAAQIAQWLATLSDWNSEPGWDEDRVWLLTRAALPGASVAVLSETRRGLWLDAAVWPRETERLAQTLRREITRHAPETPVILCAPPFQSAVQAAFPAAQVAGFDSATAQQLGQNHPALAEQLLRTPKVTEDFAWLRQPHGLGLARRLERALNVAAQSLLRRFAQRLTGFANAPLAHLWRNFLDLPARYEEETARRVVRLGCPPLQVILNMTGMPRQNYRLPWLDARPLALFQEE